MKKIAQIILFLSVLYAPLSMAQSTSKSVVKANTLEKKPIIIYGSDTCHHCTDTKKFLNDNKIAFVFYDIDKDQKALNEMLAKLKAAKISANGLSIPVIDKDGEVFTNNIAFDEFLKKLK
jgi:glutaredoxin 3